MPHLTRAALLASGALAVPAGLAAWAGIASGGRRTVRPRSPGEPIRLSFWGGWAGPDGAVMQRLVQQFNDAVPGVQVRLTIYSWDILFDRWQAEFDGGEPPDVVAIHATEVAEYASRGMLYDITHDAQRYGLHGADFFGPVWDLCQFRGALYGIPLDIHPLGLYIDADAARRAGLDVRRPPRNGAELLSWAGRLTDTRQGAWGYAAPAGDVECFRQWYSLLYQYGGRFLDGAQKHCRADSMAGRAAFSFLRDLIVRYRVAMPHEGSVDADFVSGKVAMYLQGPWYIDGLRQAGRRFITAPAPRIGAVPAVWANSHILGVVNTLDTQRVDAALRFIAWLDARALAWAEAGQIPARNTTRARLHTARIWPYLRPFALQLPHIVYQPNSLVHTQLFAENLPTPVINATQAVVLGRETPAEAARTLSKDVDQILSSPIATLS